MYSHAYWTHVQVYLWLQAVPPEGIMIYGSQLHTHLTGIRVSTRHIRDGRELPEINQDNHYSTHFQEIRLLKRQVRILPVSEGRFCNSRTHTHKIWVEVLQKCSCGSILQVCDILKDQCLCLQGQGVPEYRLFDHKDEGTQWSARTHVWTTHITYRAGSLEREQPESTRSQNQTGWQGTTGIHLFRMLF